MSIKQYNANARFAGALFLLAIFAAIAGGAMIDAVLGKPDFAANFMAGKMILSSGVALEYVNGIAVIGIAAFLYPVLRQHNEAIAIFYVGFRLVEAILYLLGATIPLVMLALASRGVMANSQTLVPLLALRSGMMELAVPVFLSLGCLLLNYSFFKTGIIPRSLSIWGLIAAVLVSIGNIWAWPALVQIALVLPVLFYEIVLGLWLIIKGFYPSQ